jgi:hypothetical protein
MKEREGTGTGLIWADVELGQVVEILGFPGIWFRKVDGEGEAFNETYGVSAIVSDWRPIVRVRPPVPAKPEPVAVQQDLWGNDAEPERLPRRRRGGRQVSALSLLLY